MHWRTQKAVVILAVASAAVALGVSSWAEARVQRGNTYAALTQCTAETTIALVRRFVAAYSHGQVVRLVDAFWAPSGRFLWFSTGPPGKRLGRPAYDRSTLAAYFRGRVRAHERLRLIELRAGYDAARDLVHFSGKLVRTADERPPPRTPHDFKGAADCVNAKPRLIVWSM
jgi:hypothetical protein